MPVIRILENPCHLGDGLDIVDDRGTGVKTFRRWERRLEARMSSPSLEGIQQGSFFAADVGSGAGVDGNLEVAEQPCLGGFTDSGK